MMTQNRPETTEYAPYYGKYVSLVPSGDFLEILRQDGRDFAQLLSPLTEEQGNFRYEPGKWSVKETVGHVNDAERIFTYRLLRIARGDQTPLPGFEQDDFVKNGGFAARSLAGLIEEFEAVRHATTTLVKSLDNAAWLRRGVASQNPITALALAFVIVGHVRHHRLILEQRYLPALPRN